jgi:hypothetical protein
MIGRDGVIGGRGGVDGGGLNVGGEGGVGSSGVGLFFCLLWTGVQSSFVLGYCLAALFLFGGRLWFALLDEIGLKGGLHLRVKI